MTSADRCERGKVTPAWSIAASLAALAIAMPVQSASADGLVVESAAADYSVGDIIAAGAQIVLSPGERLTVLDQSGARVDVSESGAYGEAISATEPAGGLSVAEIAVDPGHRADIGGTRTEDLEACLEHAEVRDDLDPDDCLRAQKKGAEGPSLDVGLAVRAATFKPGDPLIFKLKSSFDARVFCSAAASGDAQIAYPMELAGPDQPLRLMSNVTAMAPQRGSPRLVAPDAPGDYDVECFAVDGETFETFRTATSEISHARPETWLLRSYAEMRGAPFALDTLTVTVTP